MALPDSVSFQRLTIPHLSRSDSFQFAGEYQLHWMTHEEYEVSTSIRLLSDKGGSLFESFPLFGDFSLSTCS